MKRILIGVGLVAVVVAIALATRNRLPRAEEAADTVPGAIVAPVDTARLDILPSDSAALDSAAATPDGAGSPDAATPDGAAPAAGGGSQPATGGSQPATGNASAPRPQPPAGGEPASASQRVGPEQILARAATAYEGVRSMQAEFAMTMTNPLLRRTTNSRGTIYQRRPDRIALRFAEPAGDVIVSDGQHFWVYYPSVDERQVIRMPASQGAAGGVDLQAQFIGDPTARFQATLHGTETVAGRAAHVLTLEPRARLGYRALKVWLDAEDYLARRFEIVEDNGSVRRFDLTGLRTNVRLGDDVFRFTPPADARIVDRG